MGAVRLAVENLCNILLSSDTRVDEFLNVLMQRAGILDKLTSYFLSQFEFYAGSLHHQ